MAQYKSHQDRAPSVWLDLMDECDNFPYYHNNPAYYDELLAGRLWRFVLGSYPDDWETVGFMLDSVVQKMPWTKSWSVNPKARIVSVHPDKDGVYSPDTWTRAISDQLEKARKLGTFELLTGWRDEHYAIDNSIGIDARIERAGSPLFGIITFGVHLTAYVKAADGMKIWVPRRSQTKQTYPSMLDNTAAGGIAAGEDPLESIVRECGEEASLPAELVREHIVACGTVSYWHERDERAGGESGMMQPECQFIYDLELAPHIVPKPSDDEVAGFELLSLDQVHQALNRREFKPNCALIMIDFLIRHGKVPNSEQSHLLNIVPRLHRLLQFDRGFQEMERSDLSLPSSRQHRSGSSK